jgi:hypothetical protein
MIDQDRQVIEEEAFTKVTFKAIELAILKDVEVKLHMVKVELLVMAYVLHLKHIRSPQVGQLR